MVPAGIFRSAAIYVGSINLITDIAHDYAVLNFLSQVTIFLSVLLCSGTSWWVAARRARDDVEGRAAQAQKVMETFS